MSKRYVLHLSFFHYYLTRFLFLMLQKEFNAGKQFVKDMNVDSHLKTRSNLMFNHLKNDKVSFNLNHSLELNKLRLTNSSDNMDDPSIEQNNELQITKDIKQTKHMMRFFNKQSKSQGCIY